MTCHPDPRQEEELVEFRKAVIDAKVRLVLGLGPETELGELWREVTVEEQQQEVEELTREVERLKNPQEGGANRTVELQRNLQKTNREFDEVAFVLLPRILECHGADKKMHWIAVKISVFCASPN